MPLTVIHHLSLVIFTVHEPGLIRGQMDFSAMVMMKMFLGAMASCKLHSIHIYGPMYAQYSVV